VPHSLPKLFWFLRSNFVWRILYFMNILIN
jgi:hypothetical protein